MTKDDLNSLYGMRKNVLSSMYGIQSSRSVLCSFWVRFWLVDGILKYGRCIYADTDGAKYIEEMDCKRGEL